MQKVMSTLCSCSVAMLLGGQALAQKVPVAADSASVIGESMKNEINAAEDRALD